MTGPPQGYDVTGEVFPDDPAGRHQLKVVCQHCQRVTHAAWLPVETVEVCPNDGAVAHFKCAQCGEEWYTSKASMAHSNQRFAPEVRALKMRVAELEAALRLAQAANKVGA